VGTTHPEVLMAGFDGLTAVVTGASSGIGLATATRLLAHGAQVAVIDRQPFPGPDAVLSLTADVTDQEAVNRAIRSVISAFGQLDVVINNAGIAAVGSVVDNPDEEWRSVFDVNVLGIVRMMRACLPELQRSQHGAVVNVSSVAATTGLVQRACYSASKGAVLSLTLAMSADLLADRIRVNCVTPGTIDTPWVGRLLAAAADPDQERAALEQRQPMGRLGLAEEVASAIAFLASPESSFITGIALPVDGGMAGLNGPGKTASDGAYEALRTGR
jgi:2-keto-3-deoxy-L-fuconate dehydrogenase